mgnify:CR=1 FL=1
MQVREFLEYFKVSQKKINWIINDKKYRVNGEIKDVECYPYPYKVDNGVYVTKWTSPEKTLVNDSYLADEYIVEIKDC